MSRAKEKSATTVEAHWSALVPVGILIASVAVITRPVWFPQASHLAISFVADALENVTADYNSKVRLPIRHSAFLPEEATNGTLRESGEPE